MSAYGDLLRSPGIVGVFSSQVLARLPIGLLSIATLLHVEELTGSYATAGLVVACLSIGEAVMVPVTSRLTTVVGVRPLLLVTAAVNAAALTVLAGAGPHDVPLMILGTVVGLSVPPLMPVVRALYPRLVSDRAIPAAFAVDTTMTEIIYIFGPVAATLLASTIGTPVPLALSAVLTVAGTVWFLSNRAVGGVRLAKPASRFGRVLANRAMLVSASTALLLLASFTAMEVGIVARFTHDGVIAGLAIAMSSLGSLVGGLALGHRRLGVGGTALSLGAVAVGTGLVGVVTDPLLLALALFLSGVGFAPALAALYLMVSRAVPQEDAAEAFGWVNMTSLVGGAAGTSLAGVVADITGDDGAMVLAASLAALATLVPLAARLGGPLPGLSRSLGV